MKSSVYLNVVNCKEAIKFYEEVFQTSVENIMEQDGKVLYSELRLGTTLINLSDINTDLVIGNNYSITVDVDTDEEVLRIHDLLIAGGQIQMELQETFFATKYVFVTDKFGINWQILNQKPMPPM